MPLRSLVLLSFLFLQSVSGSGQKKDEIFSQTDQSLPNAIKLYREILSIPNDAHYPDHITANLEWCNNEFIKRGFETTVIDSEQVPLLLAERVINKNYPTILIYLQIDGQPVDTSFWFQDSPYTPVLKEREGENWEIIPWDKLENNWNDDWRIFARSASDAKGPVAMFLTAMDIMSENKWKPRVNLKVIMDFEEELGSPHLPDAVNHNREILSSDALIILDGPRHITNRPTLTFGARGIATITLTLYGPRAPQHSGHYGNYAPNPAFRLTQLLSGMKDDQGRVLLPGFYDGISLDEETLTILESVPDDEEYIRSAIGIASIDSVGYSYQTAIQYPSLNIRGLRSGWVGDKVRTIVPDVAIAEIDVRLVMESNPERLLGLIKEYISDQGYYIISDEPTEEERLSHKRIVKFESEISYLAFRTDFNAPVGQWLTRGLSKTFGETPIRLRTSGGSIPISPFVTTLGIPAVTVPTVNRDNNQHSPNENLRLGNFREGIATVIGILTEKY